MTPDESLIAQLQEAHGRATKHHSDKDGEFSGDYHFFTGHALSNLPRLTEDADRFGALAIRSVPRLIELAREALASRAVCEAAKNYWHNS